MLVVAGCTTTSTNTTDPTPTPSTDAMEADGDAMDKTGGDGSGSGQVRDDSLEDLDETRLADTKTIADAIALFQTDNDSNDVLDNLPLCNREKLAIGTDADLSFLVPAYLAEIPTDPGAEGGSYSICENQRKEIVVWSEMADSSKINTVVGK